MYGAAGLCMYTTLGNIRHKAYCSRLVDMHLVVLQLPGSRAQYSNTDGGHPSPRREVGRNKREENVVGGGRRWHPW